MEKDMTVSYKFRDEKLPKRLEKRMWIEKFSEV